MTASFKLPDDFPSRFVFGYRLLYALRALARWLRIQAPVTKRLGYQYSVAPDLIEIDLTYACNLRCFNCNRSSAQAPEALHISLETVRRFVDESVQSNRRWRRIRLLGGEPTLHPQFPQILAELRRYADWNPETRIQLVTNGCGPRVSRVLARVGRDIEIENSRKTGPVQPAFGPFNLAPKDSVLYRFADYRNGCAIMHECGIGLTPQGYYPCAIAGGIDRVLGLAGGRQSLPPVGDDMRDLTDTACRLCGRFRDGHFIPFKLRRPLLSQRTSPSWRRIYGDWARRQRGARHGR